MHKNALLMNHLANLDLQWRSFCEACFWITPDIEALLLFTLHEHICYLDAEIPLPDWRYLNILDIDWRHRRTQSKKCYQDSRKSKDNKQMTWSNKTIQKDSCWNEGFNPKCNITLNRSWSPYWIKIRSWTCWQLFKKLK